MIIWTKAYLVNNEEQTIANIDTGDSHTDYKKYINFLLDSIEKSNKLTAYKLTSDTSEVFLRVLSSVGEGIDEENGKAKDESTIDSNCEIITKRFLRKELKGQKHVQSMKVEIRSGCLIHAFIKEADSYQYLIAKMDWSDFIERVGLNRSQGIEINKKRLGKSCLFTFNLNKEIRDIRVLLDNSATYFTSDFLELEPAYSDEHNTEVMSSTTVQVIDSCLKKKYPQDRLILRNTFLHYLRTKDFVDFDDIQQNIFKPYLESPLCKINDDDKSKFSKKISDLPNSRHFSCQFNIVPSEIKNNIIRNTYKLTSFANLLILNTSSTSDIFNKIKSGSDSSGATYLKIYTTDQEAINTFKPRENIDKIE